MQIGILNYLVDKEELESFTIRLCEQIIDRSTKNIAAIKETVHVLTKSHVLDVETFEKIQSLREKIFNSSEYEESIRTFLQRKAVFSKLN